jgi:teichuronic acid biosynthesis glycosyltransferase TuaG
MELVSVIMPAFNTEKFISEAIISVQKQTYQNWELIVVDDFSSDKTKEIVQNLMDDDIRIHLICLNKNSGTGVARNTALNTARGRFIAFLDADDLWKPEKLHKQIAFMQANHLTFTFSFYDCIDEAGVVLNKRIEAPKKLTYRQLFFCNFIGNLTGIYDTKFHGKVAISAIRKRQDWMVWLTIVKKLTLVQPVPESLALYRIRKNSISASKWRLLQHNYAVYRQFHQYSILVSLLCMIGFLFTQFVVKPSYVKKPITSI